MKEKDRMDKLVTVLKWSGFSPEFVAGKIAEHCKDVLHLLEHTDVWLDRYTLEELEEKRKEYYTNYRRFLALKRELESEFWEEIDGYDN